jgi:ligand-binding SRPBCC domain-containing protein
MPVIRLTTEIRAPIERVFDLSLSIDFHVASTAHTGEQAVGGVTSGLIGLGQEVTWRAQHFGVWQRLTSRITALERPTYFQDTMVRGIFTHFCHDHHFSPTLTGTLLKDVFDYEAPLGIAGRCAARLFVTPHLHNLLSLRNRLLAEAAESEEWRHFLK